MMISLGRKIEMMWRGNWFIISDYLIDPLTLLCLYNLNIE